MIKTFENGIYPIAFVVAIDAKKEDICNHYCIYDKDHKPIMITEALYDKMISSREAITFEGVSYKDYKVLIMSIFSTFDGRVVIDMNVIAHECCHVADKICDTHNIKYGTFDNGEAHAYICGWAAGCVEKCLKDNTKIKNPKK